MATGSASHNDHGQHILHLFKNIIENKVTDFTITNTPKLDQLAESLGIDTEDRSVQEIGRDVYNELEKTFSNVEGEMPFMKRVPPATLELWRKDGIVPRGP